MNVLLSETQLAGIEDAAHVNDWPRAMVDVG
jgi:hypothetical protein